MTSSALLREERPKRGRHPILLSFAAVALNLLALFNGALLFLAALQCLAILAVDVVAVYAVLTSPRIDATEGDEG